MRVYCFVALALSALLLGCDAAKKKATTSTSQKSTSKAADSSGFSSEKRTAAIMKAIAFNPMISLTDNNFTKFVTDRPRDYHAVLMFTATAPKYQCSVCVKSMEVFEEIASFYNKQYVFNTTAAENKIAFFKIEVDDGRGIFNELQLETVPRLFMLPPVTVDSPRAKISNYEMDNRVLLEGTSRLLEVIHTATGIKVGHRCTVCRQWMVDSVWYYPVQCADRSDSGPRAADAGPGRAGDPGGAVRERGAGRSLRRAAVVPEPQDLGRRVRGTSKSPYVLMLC